MSNPEHQKTAAELVVSCLEAEGVEYIFGIAGEENLGRHHASARDRLPISISTSPY